MSDAGTLAYLEPIGAGGVGEAGEAGEAGGVEAACSAAAAGGGGAAGRPGLAAGRLRRQSPERRAERWRRRLPLLDEDPGEEELPHLVPGEESRQPVELTPLGERLVGLVAWEDE